MQQTEHNYIYITIYNVDMLDTYITNLLKGILAIEDGSSVSSS